jgi:hypothetical protein
LADFFFFALAFFFALDFFAAGFLAAVFFAVFFLPLPLKADSQPSEYFFVEPTRTIDTVLLS